MPSSQEEMAMAVTPPVKLRPSRLGKIWRFLAAGGALVSLLALLAWGLTRDPRGIPTPLIGKQASPFTLGRRWRRRSERDWPGDGSNWERLSRCGRLGVSGAAWLLNARRYPRRRCEWRVRFSCQHNVNKKEVEHLADAGKTPMFASVTHPEGLNCQRETGIPLLKLWGFPGRTACEPL
jgi:hypothetical protein